MVFKPKLLYFLICKFKWNLNMQIWHYFTALFYIIQLSWNQIMSQMTSDHKRYTQLEKMETKYWQCILTSPANHTDSKAFLIFCFYFNAYIKFSFCQLFVWWGVVISIHFTSTTNVFYPFLTLPNSSNMVYLRKNNNILNCAICIYICKK